MRGDGVGQAACVVDASDGRENFRRNFFVEFDVLVKLLHHCAAQSLNFTAGFGRGYFDRCDVRGEMRFAVFNTVDFGALLAFDQNFDRAVWQLQHLQDGGNATDLEHVGDFGFVFGGGFLCNEHDATLCGHGCFERFDALRTSYKKWDDHVRKHDDVA